jgi:hypothetical protein
MEQNILLGREHAPHCLSDNRLVVHEKDYD